MQLIEHQGPERASLPLTHRLESGWLRKAQLRIWVQGDGSAQATLELTQEQQQAIATEPSRHILKYAKATFARATRGALIELLNLPADHGPIPDFGRFALDTRMRFHFDGQKIIWDIDIAQIRQILQDLGATKLKATEK
jgi:hypothetical protein